MATQPRRKTHRKAGAHVSRATRPKRSSRGHSAKETPIKIASPPPNKKEKKEPNRKNRLLQFFDAPLWMQIVVWFILAFLMADSTIHEGKIIVQALTWAIGVLKSDFDELSEALKELREVTNALLAGQLDLS